MSRLTVSMPSDPHSRIVQSIEPGQKIAFSFPLDGASFARDGASLSVTFGNNSVVFKNFFTAGKDGLLPSFELVDGTQVDGAALLLRMDPAFDISLAAGTQAATSSGAGEYTDDASSLLHGVDRLGSLSPGAAEGGKTASAGAYVPDARTTAFGADAPAGEDDSKPASGFTSYARAVWYVGNDTPGAGHTLSVQPLFPGASGNVAPAGSVSGVTVTPSDAWNPSWGSWSYNPGTGCMDITLTASGHAALVESGGKMVDFFSFTVTDQAGKSYAYGMQVVLTNDRAFDSHKQDALDARDDRLADGAALHGEWHNGYSGTNTDGNYSIVSSSGNDRITVSEAFQNGSTLYASSTPDGALTGGSDVNSIELSKGMSAVNGVHNLVDSSNGTIIVGRDTAPDEVPDWLYGTSCSSLYARENSQNTIQGHESVVTIKADGENIPLDGSGYPAALIGVRAIENGVNTVDAKTVLIDMHHEYKSSPYAAGVKSEDTGRNSIGSKEAGSLVDIKVVSGFAAIGVDGSGGKNVIGAESIRIFSKSTDDGANIWKGDASGVSSTGGGTNAITAGNTLSVRAEAEKNGGANVLVLSADASTNSVTVGGKATLTAEAAGGNAYGFYAKSGATNSLSADGDVILRAETTAGKAVAFYANNSLNEITQSASVEVDAIGGDGDGKQGIALQAASGGKNIIGSDSFVDLTAKANKAYGLYATNNGTNNVSADSVTVTATGGSEAYGLHAASGGTNTVTADDVLVEHGVSSGGGKSYGMYAYAMGTSQSSNIIQAGEGALTLTIKAASGTLGESWAMYAEGQTMGTGEAANKIIGGAKGDSISLEGNVHVEGGSGGRNIIATHGGDDTISLKGDVTAERGSYGYTSIEAGRGDDSIIIDGRISSHFNPGNPYPTTPEALKIDGGEGYDVLVLKAANVTDMYDRYGLWLKVVLGSQRYGMNSKEPFLRGIEAVQLDGITWSELQNTDMAGIYDLLQQNGITVIVGGVETISQGDLAQNFTGTVDTSYTASFDAPVDLGGSTVTLAGGADRLTFSAGLTNADLDMGLGNDYLILGGDLEHVKADMGGGNDHLTVNQGSWTNASVDMGAGNDHVYLNGHVSGLSLSGGEGLDALHLAGAGDSLSLFDLAQQIGGFEILDLSGGEANTLVIDGFLSALNPDTGINLAKGTFINGLEAADLAGKHIVRITGDEHDSVCFDSSTQYNQVTGQVTYENVTYDVYQDDSASNYVLLVQSGLVG